ncbi:hypothetical protein GCM10009665_61690 [Kitasatospora nipponensis]|uniref:CHAP domain-containing protein n=1 Tax=Kitasatospora nipponensis TaxID=258049 RepID=A0ABN1WT27_9ACTN
MAAPLAVVVTAAPAHADAPGGAIATKALSYVGRDHMMGPWYELWCGDFVKRVWTQEGVAAQSWMSSYVPNWLKSPNYHPIGTYTPQPGDAVIWNDLTYNDRNGNPGSHISIVTKYANGLLSDVGGDQGGGQDKNQPWWATSHVNIDEDNGGLAFDPTKHLFPNKPYEMWVRGYISPGTATPPPPPQAPQVTTALPSGQPYSGKVTFTGHTDIGVNAFYFHLTQGAKNIVSPTVPGTPHTSDHPWIFDTKTLQNGSADLWATAVTPAGTVGTSVHTQIQINNAPPPPPVPPQPPAPVVSVPTGPVSGTVTLSATDSDSTVQSIQFYANGTAIGSPVGRPFQLGWDTTATGNYGTVTITAEATSPGGTSPASAGADVYVNRVPQIRPATVKDMNGTVHVYTIAEPNGELEETLIAPDGGTTWTCVTCNVGTPMSQGAPTAVIDSSATIHVYTIAKPNGELEETLIAPDGGTAWSCLTCNGGAEPATGAPSAVIDGSGTVHVYTLAAASGEVDETLSAPDGGLAWSCLSCNGGAEPGYGAPSAVIDGNGNIHVFTLAGAGFFNSGEIDETTIPANGQMSWVCLSCSNGGAEPAAGAPAAVIDKDGTIRVYTLAISGFFNPGELDETRISATGSVENVCLSCSGNGGAEPANGAPAAVVDASGAIHVYTYAIAGFFNPGELDETTVPTSGAAVNTCVTCNGGAPEGGGTPTAVLDGAGAIHVFSVGTPNGDLDESWPGGSAGWQTADRTSGAPNTPSTGA